MIALLTLALGIGENTTASFSVVYARAFAASLVKGTGAMVVVWNKGAEATGGDRTPLAGADLLNWRAQSNSFDAIAAFRLASLYVTGRSIR